MESITLITALGLLAIGLIGLRQLETIKVKPVKAIKPVATLPLEDQLITLPTTIVKVALISAISYSAKGVSMIHLKSGKFIEEQQSKEAHKLLLLEYTSKLQKQIDHANGN